MSSIDTKRNPTSIRETKDSVAGDIESGPSILIEGRERASSAASDSIIFSTFNIRYGAGPRLISGGILRRFGFDKITAAQIDRNLDAAALAFSNCQLMPRADIIAIQEADIETVRAGQRNIPAALGELLSMVVAQAPEHSDPAWPPKPKQWYLDFERPIAPDEAGATGLALLSRFDFTAVARIPLPWTECPSRPRLALASTIQLQYSKILVINVHVDPHAAAAAQLEQHRAILDYARDVDCPVVYAGDFNTLSKSASGAMTDLLHQAGFSTPLPQGLRTWRAGIFGLHTDWIFVRNAAIKRWGVARPLRVSDHWPVWAEINCTGVRNVHGE